VRCVHIIKNYTFFDTEQSTPLPSGYLEAIEVFFKDELSKKSTPTLAKCRTFLNNYTCDKTTKQVQDKVRALNTSK